MSLLADQGRAIRRQLLAHRVEEGAQFAELITRREIERDAKLAFAEPRQAASEDMNGPQEELREKRRDEHRDPESDGRGNERRAQRSVQLLPHQQGRNADSDRAKGLVS